MSAGLRTCAGCRKAVDLLVDGFRCLDCPFFFCRPCAEYHFNLTDVSPVTGRRDPERVHAPRPGHAFTETEYLADAKRIVEYAMQNGRACVMRSDGSVRVDISIPAADATV